MANNPYGLLSRRYGLNLPGMGQPAALPPEAYTGAIEGGAIAPRPGMATNPAASSQASVYDTVSKLYPARNQVDPRSPAGIAANALQGFAMGAEATPAQAGYAPTAGGVVGGLKAIGGGFAQRQALVAAQDADRRKLLDTVAAENLKERVKQPFDIARENRADQQWRSKEDYRVGQQYELLRKGTKLKAQQQGVPDDVADRARTQAATNVQSLGITPASPGYNEIYLQEFDKILSTFHKTRQEAFPKAPGSAPASRPVTADEFIGGGGLGQ